MNGAESLAHSGLATMNPAKYANEKHGFMRPGLPLEFRIKPSLIMWSGRQTEIKRQQQITAVIDQRRDD